MAPPKAPRVNLKPDVSRLLESVAFVIAEAERRGRTLSRYEVVKSLFLADRAHLNIYGRPITFDNYFAMDHGPVPSLAYDLLMMRAPALERIGLSHDDLPWQHRRDGNILRFFGAKAKVDEDVLSPSDVEELTNALGIVLSLSFQQIRRITHEDPAYEEAWNEESVAKSFPMSLGMLFDSPNFEAAEHVEFISKHK